ncbi:MAG: hypothetical protein D6800_14905, partial [Candidatus Zixiibacteriota bacterium]
MSKRVCRQNRLCGRAGRRGWLLLLSVVVFGAAPASSQQTLTLSQVREMAFSHNRQYLSALQDVNKAGADITNARAGALPNIE